MYGARCGSSRRLLLEQLMYARIAGILRNGVVQLIEDPQSINCLSARAGSGTDDLNDLGNRLVLEKLLRTKSQARFPCLRYDLRTEERVSAQIKKIVVHTDAIQIEHVSPNASQGFFERRSR